MATVPLLAGRTKSLGACAEALDGGGRILLVAQRDSTVGAPSAQDFYSIGVIATLSRHLILPDGKMKLLVRGEQRARIVRLVDDPSCFRALAEPIEEACAAAPHLPDFSLADWAIDGNANARNRVSALQAVLEDAALTPAERLRAMGKLIGGG